MSPRSFMSTRKSRVRGLTGMGVMVALCTGSLTFVAGSAHAADTLLSEGKTATASSIEGDYWAASRAVDGDLKTRWSSAFSDPQWLQVDLGSNATITKVVLDWETAYGKSFSIETSNNGEDWTPIYTTKNGKGGTDTLDVTGKGRYVRLDGGERGTGWGFSLWEFQVFGTPGAGGPVTTPSATPTTAAPSDAPTTAAPSDGPTTAAPSDAPTTAGPTIAAPSDGPTTAAPSDAPTTAGPTTAAPSDAPTTATPSDPATGDPTPTTAAPTDPGTGTGGIETSDTPDFGPNVHVFDPSMPTTTVQTSLNEAFDAQKDTNSAQFGTRRDAFFFKPGTYDNTYANVGFNTSVLGLGLSPDDTQINGGVTVDAFNASDAGNATQNFWRSVENLAIKPTGGSDRWAVAQAAPFRRIHVKGNLDVFPASYGWASGGYIADSKIDGKVSSASQQQWYSRDSDFGSWEGSNWNMVFSGVSGAPAQSFPKPAYTTLDTTPVSREKPFLYVDDAGKYRVFVPSLRTDSKGTSWASGTTAGSSIPMSQFFVAKPADGAAKINQALAQGLNVFFTPGIYHLSETINVTRANTVLLGVGLATLIPDNGVNGVNVADVDGVKLAGLLFDAGTTNSNTLLTIGQAGSSANHAADPTTVQDVFFRIGGAVAGKATNSLVVNSNNTIVDHIWAWRADHGVSPTGWNINTADYGMIVNGDNVLATGLFVEHFEKNDVLWNGNGGETIFYQNEKAYDVPNQAAWKDGTQDGYAAYKVADDVTSHEAWGLGSYCYFAVDPTVNLAHAFEVPNAAGVKMHDLSTVSLGNNGTITHVINDTGAITPTNSTPTTVTDYP